MLCACLLMMGGVFAQEPEPTPTVAPTDTATNTDTQSPLPTDTATATSTDTLVPTDTPTSTATATAPETTPEVTDLPLVEGPTNTPTRTAVDTTGLSTWCYYWNFSAPNADNGGFTLPTSVGAGQFVDGQGWVGAVNIALPVKPTINRTLVQIQRTFESTILTNVDFAYVRQEGFVEEDLSSPIETLGIFINFVYPNTFADAEVQYFSADSNTITEGTFSWEGILGGVTSVILESQASWAESPTPATGSTRITAATFRGYGANPVGADNCDLTPTPTPTGGVCPGGFLQGTQTVGVGSCLPEPALYCMSRILTGVNLRSSPIFPQDTEPNNILQFLSGGSARLMGRFIESSDVWLRVDGYADGSQLNTSVQGWIHLSAFGGIEPCASGSINDLPELDSQGNVTSIPTPTLQPTDLSTPISTATATPTPIIVTPPPNPACTEAVTGQPVKLRSAPTTLSIAILNVDTYTPITIYWNSQGETINDSPVWLYTLINYGAPAQQYLGWIHSTLVDFRTCPSIPEATLTPTVTYTPSNTPTASNTPLPTATSTPTNTPPPDYSSQFLLPMIGTASNPPRLSNCLIPGYYDIPSRDINPRGITGGSFAVQTPARATIQIVDRIGRIPAPGIFLSIRVDLQDVPQVIRQRMATLNTTFGNIPLTAEGSLQIAYSHLTINSIPTDIEPVDIRSQILVLEQDVKPAGTIIGFSGDTGNTNGAHLDIAVYYIPDYPDVGNAFEFERWADPTFIDYRHNAEAFWSIYQVAPQGRPTVDIGTPIVVDPLVLWPILQEGTSCAFGN